MRRIIHKALRPPNNQLLETSLSVREKSWHILARNTREWLKLNQNLSSTSGLAYPDQLAGYEFRKGSNWTHMSECQFKLSSLKRKVCYRKKKRINNKIRTDCLIKRSMSLLAYVYIEVKVWAFSGKNGIVLYRHSCFGNLLLRIRILSVCCHCSFLTDT